MVFDSDDKRLEETTGEYQTCPNCSLPHKMTDTICSFCGEKLPGHLTYVEKVRRTIEAAKWRYKLKSPGNKASALASRAGANLVVLLLGVALTGVGGWFFYSAISSSSFSSFLIGAVFLLYGIYSIYNLFTKKS
ncbi:hypothetical protein MNBD_NITROSPINAE02-1040 [hydrothermal vent metagenome]|uniref:Uncharacterized protein n=1 Tax=hydrothermal vent metagenome TaxID=652676 RepID=A0A3B1BSV8_9ZZZZ